MAILKIFTGINITVLATLITTIRYMPLKRKIWQHEKTKLRIGLKWMVNFYIMSGRLQLFPSSASGWFFFSLSKILHEEPHEEGFFSGLSDAPQEDPQAACFFSGLSEEPQEAAAMQFTLARFAQSARFLRAITFLMLKVMKKIVL